MKYTRLTKEQFEELHQEFANFLASQNIDKTEWEQIKTEKPEIAEQELDVFSDLIWEGALSKTEYLEHFSKSHVFLFHFMENKAHSIVIYCTNPNIDFLTKEGLIWLSEHISSNNLSAEQTEIEIKQGKKSFEDKKSNIFSLIQQGALISNGDLYNQVKHIFGI